MERTKHHTFGTRMVHGVWAPAAKGTLPERFPGSRWEKCPAGSMKRFQRTGHLKQFRRETFHSTAIRREDSRQTLVLEGRILQISPKLFCGGGQEL